MIRKDPVAGVSRCWEVPVERPRSPRSPVGSGGPDAPSVAETPEGCKAAGMDTCTSCQQSLAGSTLTMAWEDGDNASAYVTCSHCGEENIQSGFGGDD